MGLWPPKVMKNGFCSATALHGGVALPFVIPSAAEGSAVPRTLRGNVFRQSVAEGTAVSSSSNGYESPPSEPSM
jgi:hypothetical protein